MTYYWFIPSTYRRRERLACFTCFLAFIVILLGAYTRLTDAGLSCPDWPHCYGYAVVPHTTLQIQHALETFPMMPLNIQKAWTEMSHRYLAGTEGLFILLLSGAILFARKASDLKTVLIASALAGLLLLQITLGMLTVTEKLKPVIVLSHLITGIGILSLLWWAYLDLRARNHSFRYKNNQLVIIFSWLGLALLIGQITLGGWVSTHYAGLACIDLPYCNGQLVPNLEWSNLNGDLITIHMLHRIGAIITGTFLTLLCLRLFIDKSFRFIAFMLLTFMLLQIALGILNIMWLRPVWVALAHHGVAILLVLTLITTLVKAHNESRDNKYGSWIA